MIPASRVAPSDRPANFNVNWTLDVWGRIRRQVESASASYDATLSNYDGVVVLVVGQVAQTYLLIRTTEQRLAAAEQNLAYQTESVRISEAKLQAGDISSLDVEQDSASSTIRRRQSRSWNSPWRN